MLILYFVLVLIICYCNPVKQQQKILTFTHNWCRKSDKAKVIVSKLQSQTNIENLKFQIFQFTQDFFDNTIENSFKKTIKDLQLENIYQTKNVPFPSIYIHCQNYRGFYQNQLNFVQLKYWIEVYCRPNNYLPFCSQTPQQYKFQIFEQNWKKMNLNYIKKHYQFLINNPQVKICLKKGQNKNKIKDDDFIFGNSKISFDQLSKLEQTPLYFKSFNHNIRNFMILQNKTAIMIIYKDSNNYKINQFQQVYKSLVTQKNLMTEQLRKVRDQYPLVYQISDQNKKNIIFIAACYNPLQNSKCDSKNKTSLSFKSKQKTIKNLLNFMNMKDYFQLTNKNQLIFSFKFNYESKTIQKYIYDDSSHKLGNQFLFWIDWISTQTKKQYQLIKTQDLCLKNQTIHTYDPRNLSDIAQNIKLIKFYAKKKLQIQINSQSSVVLNKFKFKICKQFKQPFYTNQIQNVFSYFQEKQENIEIVQTQL